MLILVSTILQVNIWKMRVFSSVSIIVLVMASQEQVYVKPTLHKLAPYKLDNMCANYT